MGIMLVSLAHPSGEFSRVIVLTVCLPHAALKPDPARGASSGQVQGSLLEAPGRRARSARGGAQKACCAQEALRDQPCLPRRWPDRRGQRSRRGGPHRLAPRRPLGPSPPGGDRGDAPAVVAARAAAPVSFMLQPIHPVAPHRTRCAGQLFLAAGELVSEEGAGAPFSAARGDLSRPGPKCSQALRGTG